MPELRQIFNKPALMLIGGLMVTLIACEAMLRVRPIRNLLMQPNPYYYVDLSTRIDAADDFLQSNGQPEVLAIGSSIVRTGFNAKLFGELRGTVAFNAGLSGICPEQTAFYFAHVWLKKFRPKQVLFLVRAEDLIDGRTLEKQVESSGGRFELATLNKTRTAKFEWELAKLSRLFYYNGSLSKALVDGRSIRRQTIFPIDAHGWNADKRILSPFDANESGVKIAYGPISVSPSFRNVMKQIGALCESNRIELRVVNIPEWKNKFFDPMDYLRYLSALSALCQEQGVPFVDVTSGRYDWLGDRTNFADRSHLNAAGATAFTKILAAQMSAQKGQ